VFADLVVIIVIHILKKTTKRKTDEETHHHKGEEAFLECTKELVGEKGEKTTKTLLKSNGHTAAGKISFKECMLRLKRRVEGDFVIMVKIQKGRQEEEKV
jgi:hypothetical protein